MKKIYYPLITWLILFSLFFPAYGTDESYSFYFYLNNSVIYPDKPIPVNGQIYYYHIKKSGNFQEKVTFKIYEIPMDLPAGEYEKYCSDKSPIEEKTKKVTMENYYGYYWRSYFDMELPELKAGNYYITASTPKAKYSCPLRVSSIAMIGKIAKNCLTVMVQDKKTGQILQTDVNIYSGGETKKYKTNSKDGLLRLYPEDIDLTPGKSIRIIALDNKNSAEINLSVPTEQKTFRGYIYTDRPVYRPDQKVNFKGTFRYGDKLEYASKKDIKVIIKDNKNTEIYNKTLQTDEYGAISGDITLGKEPPLGVYHIYCTDGDNQQATGNFKVEEYRKPEFEIQINPDKEKYIQGQKITFNIEAKYYFGAPVTDKEFKYEIYRNYYYPYSWFYWWEEDCLPYYYNYGSQYIASGTGKVDKNGKASFSCEAGKIDYDATYMVKVRMVDESRREVASSSSVMVSRGAFYITVRPEKYYYESEEKVRIKVEAKDYSDKPISREINLTVKYEKYDDGKWNWEEKKKLKIKTDDKGLVYVDYIPPKDGYYTIECTGTDENKNEIKGSGYFYCYSGSTGYNWYRFSNIEIIPDKNYYETGEDANFFIVCPFQGVKALATVDGDKVFHQEVMDFSNKTAGLKVKLTEAHTPNFYITVSFFYEGVFYYQSKKVVCPAKDKFITLSIEGDKEKYRPRDTAKFIIKTLDKNNKPVTSQVTMGVADESVYAVAGENTPNIQKFFYGMKQNKTWTYSSLGNVQGGYYNYNYEGIVKPCCDDGRLYENAVMSAGELKKDNSAQPSLVQPEFTREYFPDTAYFNPSVITDQNGIAEVTFQMPDSLTTWRITARGISKDTKVGENTKKVIVSKNLLARLIMPRFFTERDETYITGVIHNYLDKEKTVHAKLETKGGIEILDNGERKVMVSPNGTGTINWKVKVNKTGDFTVKLTALTDEESDALQMNIPALPHGAEKFSAAGGSTKDKVEEELILPKEAEKGSAKCLIILDPSLGSAVLSSLDYLIGFPYGCVEQTMSRFLPNVVVKKTLGELDLYDPNINKDLPKMVDQGLGRLYKFHHGDGGWGWWENDESHPYMTSYVVYGLTLAKEAGYKIDESKIKSGLSWMKKRYEKEKDSSTKAYMAFSATIAGEDCKEWLMELYKERNELDNYAKAILTISLQKAGFIKEAKEMALLLEKNVETTGTIACWTGKTGSHGWTDNVVETTSYCLTALLLTNPESDLIPKVVRYIAISRRGDRWHSTKDTAAAVMALTGYIKASKELNPDFTADVYFNGTKIKSLKFTKEDVGKAGKEISLSCDQGLLEGKNKIRLEMNGKGVLYYAMYLKYYTGEEHVKGQNSGFKISRKYYLINPDEKDEKKGKKELGSNGEIKVNAQDIILVELSLTGAENYEYVMIEDPKPAGCEFDTKQRENYNDQNYWYANRELRDEKMVYFCTYYWHGERKVTYRLRAETPGTFHVMPAKVTLMYNPEIGGNSDEVIMKITEKDK